MKKLFPVIMIILLLTSMRLDLSIARLSENHNDEVVLLTGGIDIPGLKVEVYPNPVENNRINIIANQNIRSVKILNVLGSVVFNEQYDEGTNNVQLDLNRLNKGLYLLKVEFAKEETYTEKIMVK
jgi:hypothetical protein